MWIPTPNLPHGYGGLFIMAAFVGSLVWIVWLDRRQARFSGPSEVSAAAQASLAQAARAMYVGPEFKLCNPAQPSEFDTHMLSLFDSIEGNRDDIDARLEELRVYLKSKCDLFARVKNKQKLTIVYRNMRGQLVRGAMGQSDLGRRQLLANWAKLGNLAGGEGPSRKVPKIWIHPPVDGVAPEVF